MEKRIMERGFFEEKADEVARNLLGKFICCKSTGQKYLIIETEAYYYNEKDNNGKYFCYGVKNDTGEINKTCASIPLFQIPGTWCVYGGQLLLSVTTCEFPDNVLIKAIKAIDGKTYTPDGIAKELKLYKKDSTTNYWNVHGIDSLSEDADLFLVDGKTAPYNSSKRKNINNEKALNYQMKVD